MLKSWLIVNLKWEEKFSTWKYLKFWIQSFIFCCVWPPEGADWSCSQSQNIYSIQYIYIYISTVQFPPPLSHFFFLTLSELIHLPQSHVWVFVFCFFPLTFVCNRSVCRPNIPPPPPTPPLLGLLLSGSMSRWRRSFSPPPVLTSHIHYYMALAQSSLFLLCCSITLSSWGERWCQATVMTFWLSVFMWWMRWKCTTTAKQDLALGQPTAPPSGQMKTLGGGAGHVVVGGGETSAWRRR